MSIQKSTFDFLFLLEREAETEMPARALVKKAGQYGCWALGGPARGPHLSAPVLSFIVYLAYANAGTLC